MYAMQKNEQKISPQNGVAQSKTLKNLILKKISVHKVSCALRYVFFSLFNSEEYIKVTNIDTQKYRPFYIQQQFMFIMMRETANQNFQGSQVLATASFKKPAMVFVARTVWDIQSTNYIKIKFFKKHWSFVYDRIGSFVNSFRWLPREAEKIQFIC